MNESFNSTVWRFAPKHLHCGRKIIEIAAYIAAGIFNEGYLSVLNIMSDLEIVIGTTCRDYTDKINNSRTTSQNRRSKSIIREQKNIHKQRLLEQNELYEEVEGIL